MSWPSDTATPNLAGAPWIGSTPQTTSKGRGQLALAAGAAPVASSGRARQLRHDGFTSAKRRLRLCRVFAVDDWTARVNPGIVVLPGAPPLNRSKGLDMSMTMERAATRDSNEPTTLGDTWAARLVGIGLLAATALIHLGDIRGKFDETPYLGFGYVLLVAGCAVAGVLLLLPDRTNHVRGWALAGGLCAITLLGFVLTRTVGLPSAMDDKGNWSETLGVWSLITEGVLVVLSGACLVAAYRSHTPGAARVAR